MEKRLLSDPGVPARTSVRRLSKIPRRRHKPGVLGKTVPLWGVILSPARVGVVAAFHGYDSDPVLTDFSINQRNSVLSPQSRLRSNRGFRLRRDEVDGSAFPRTPSAQLSPS